MAHTRSLSNTLLLINIPNLELHVTDIKFHMSSLITLRHLSFSSEVLWYNGTVWVEIFPFGTLK